MCNSVLLVIANQKTSKKRQALVGMFPNAVLQKSTSRMLFNGAISMKGNLLILLDLH